MSSVGNQVGACKLLSNVVLWDAGGMMYALVNSSALCDKTTALPQVRLK